MESKVKQKAEKKYQVSLTYDQICHLKDCLDYTNEYECGNSCDECQMVELLLCLCPHHIMVDDISTILKKKIKDIDTPSLSKVKQRMRSLRKQYMGLEQKKIFQTLTEHQKKKKRDIVREFRTLSKKYNIDPQFLISLKMWQEKNNK